MCRCIHSHWVPNIPTTFTDQLPSEADAHLAAIGSENAAALFTLVALGVVQSGILGDGSKPNCQVTCPDGTVRRFQIIRGKIRSRWGDATHDQDNLSEPLNDALARMFEGRSAVA